MKKLDPALALVFLLVPLTAARTAFSNSRSAPSTRATTAKNRSASPRARSMKCTGCAGMRWQKKAAAKVEDRIE